MYGTNHTVGKIRTTNHLTFTRLRYDGSNLRYRISADFGKSHAMATVLQGYQFAKMFFGKHCSWTVHEQFAELFAKANESQALANTVHGQFIKSSPSYLPKQVSHKIWQTLFMNRLWTVRRTICQSKSVTSFGKQFGELFMNMFAKSGRKFGRNSETRISSFFKFNMKYYSSRRLETDNRNNYFK